MNEKDVWWTFSRRKDAMQWTLTLLTGFLCGIVALLVTFFTKNLTRSKFYYFSSIIAKEKAGFLPYGIGYLFLLSCNLLFGFVAWLFVSFEPLAAGSGIPEIKCYLNGLNIPRVVRAKTLLCKAVGIIFSCSSGLPLGKEGPMVHAGAVIAAGVSQVKSIS